jgi:hypothetical protein
MNPDWTPRPTYMYAGVRMIRANGVMLLMVIGAVLQILGALMAAMGPIRAYRFAKSHGFPPLGHTMQDDAWGAARGLVVVVLGNLLQFLAWCLEKK